MSSANVELVKGLYVGRDVDLVAPVRDDAIWAAWVEGTYPPFLHSDVEMTVSGLPGGTKTYAGSDGARALWLDWLAPWASHRVGAEEYIDLGERVLALSYAFGRLEGSTAEVKLTHGDVPTIRDGKIARIEYYTTRPDALKAVGLEG